MPRIRTIKPEFWTDKKTGKLPPAAKCVFLGLLNHSDDYGVLRFEVDEIGVKIFPYSPESPRIVGGALSDFLVPWGLVSVFSHTSASDGSLTPQLFLYIKNFDKHQKVDKRGKPLILNFSPNMVNGAEVQYPADPPESPRTPPTEGKGKGKGKGIKKIKVTSSVGAPSSEDNFNTLWVKYPRKLKRKTALSRFQKQVKTPEDWVNIQKALPNYIRDVEQQRQRGHPDLAWQHGSTWFNENWRDYIELEASPEGNGPDGLTDWDQVRAQNNAEKGAQNAEN